MTDETGATTVPLTGRGVAFAVVLAACWLALCHGARALDTCEGTYSASLINPLQSPNVVLYQPETNDQPTDLGDRFIAGLQRGGVVMTGQPTTRLDVNSTVTPPTGAASGQPRDTTDPAGRRIHPRQPSPLSHRHCNWT